MLKHQPKTLAKTLDYIARRSPGEYGLFWDPGGTMPWKEFYWALQEDLSLRFVRESTIRELTLLGIELPFALDGTLLRLRPEFALPAYPPASDVPERLYFGLKPKNLVHTQKIGLRSTRRRFVAALQRARTCVADRRRDEKTPHPDRNTGPGSLSNAAYRFLPPGRIYTLSNPSRRNLSSFQKSARTWRKDLPGPARKPKVQALPSHRSRLVYRSEPHHLEAPGAVKPTEKGNKEGR